MNSGSFDHAGRSRFTLQNVDASPWSRHGGPIIRMIVNIPM